ncbi:MAG: PIN domain-containing protein [Candidatus Lokiarchaeota archaeon]|nr:PIN domain-containing protein [Candidatus Harpocratesius repetitus]
MELKICIDSNVFISIHNQESNHTECEKIIDAIETNQHKGLVSVIVISELLVGYYQIGEMSELNLFLSKAKMLYELIPISLSIAQEAAELRALYQIKLPDAIILATAKLYNADYLISNDIKLIKRPYFPIITAEDFVLKFL